jgi:hypothetical protein
MTSKAQLYLLNLVKKLFPEHNVQLNYFIPTPLKKCELDVSEKVKVIAYRVRSAFLHYHWRLNIKEKVIIMTFLCMALQKIGKDPMKER